MEVRTVKYKRILAALLCLLLCVCSLSEGAAAAGVIDVQHDASLKVSYRDGDTPLVGAEFRLYYVAAVDAYGSLTPTEAFARMPVTLDAESGWESLASTLEGYVQLEQVPADSRGVTDSNGEVSFFGGSQRLPLGLYLVLGERHTQRGKTYEAKPFVVLVPAEVEGNWEYHVTAYAKFRIVTPPGGGGGDDDDTVFRKVLKVWDDSGQEHDRPAQVRVKLLKNGKVYDTVTLTAENLWRHTWQDLDADAGWTVAEEPVEGYTVRVTREGVTFVVTNSFKEPPEEPDTPDQPDPPPEEPDTPPDTPPDEPETPPEKPDSPPDKPDPPAGETLPQSGQLWWPVPVLLAAGLFLITVGLLRRRGAEYED